jgi:hypothetical protein
MHRVRHVRIPVPQEGDCPCAGACRRTVRAEGNGAGINREAARRRITGIRQRIPFLFSLTNRGASAKNEMLIV